jgi:RimJ/RimL family protein N-acetyltransferase
MHSKIELSDGYVLLRRHRVDDVDAVYQAVLESIEDLSPWFAWCDKDYSLEEARRFVENQSEWWENGQVYNFAVTDESSGVYLGMCLLNHINRGDRLANLAYWVKSSSARSFSKEQTVCPQPTN